MSRRDEHDPVMARWVIAGIVAFWVFVTWLVFR